MLIHVRKKLNLKKCCVCFVCVCVQHCAVRLSTAWRQFIPIVLWYNQKYNTVSLNTTIYLSFKINHIFQLIYGHHQADYKTKTVYTEIPATGKWLIMQPLNSELHYIHYMGTETEQQNVPIRIRCSQWWVRDTTMWLSSTSAASSTITANKITEHTNKDQMFAVASGETWQCGSAGPQLVVQLSLQTE